MVNKCFTEFRRGLTRMSDAERSGRPVEVARRETIEKLQLIDNHSSFSSSSRMLHYQNGSR